MNQAPIVVDPIALQEIIQTLIGKLKDYYVFPDIAEEICRRLQKHLNDGDYSQITGGELLASTLTTHLQEVNGDKHLNVRWYAHELPEHEGSMEESPEMLEQWHRQTAFDNYGLYKAERLPGNVGYLDIRSFSRAAWAGDTAAAAMAFLAHTSALLIDLRMCRGGDPDMVALICSFLFGEDRVHLNSLYWREGDVTEQYWTLPYVPGKRFVDEPVYVLTSKSTFSGGEEFANNLKTRLRATLVGETTGGGAHPGAPYRLHPHFEVFIPNGRAINPVTGTNWEGCGVEPDITVAQEQALDVAYQMALEKVLAGLGEAESMTFSMMKDEVVMALKSLENRRESQIDH